MYPGATVNLSVTYGFEGPSTGTILMGIIFMFRLLAVPQSWIPWIQIGLITNKIGCIFVKW